MNLGPMGMIGSASGSPLAQGQGSDVNRAQQDTSDQARQTQSAEKAEEAAGVGQTEEDEEASDRDADGRRPWEIAAKSDKPAEESQTPDGDQRSKDPTGRKGQQLDLSG